MDITGLQEIYDNYEEEIQKVLAASKPGAGLFGIGASPKDDPCNQKLIDNANEWLTAFSNENPGSAEAREVLTFVLKPRHQKEENFIFWTYLAVHGATLPLVQFLNESDAEIVLEDYEKVFPKARRLPMQETLVSSLRKQAGKPEKKGLSVIRKLFP